jgi:hypothetical protein
VTPLARAVGLCALFCACNKAPAPSTGPRDAAPSAAAVATSDPHAEDDCTEGAHPAPSAQAAPTATSLSAQARERVTSLRISAHAGSVIVRKTEQGWLLAGPQGCAVPGARMEAAFQALSALRVEPTDERPGRDDFELQIVVLSGKERLLHFEVAGRKEGRDLVQLFDGSTIRVRGLDRELLSADPRAWCADPPRPTNHPR